MDRLITKQKQYLKLLEDSFIYHGDYYGIKFSNEEICNCDCNCSYCYEQQTIREQFYQLKNLFPEISDVNEELGNRRLPLGSEEWFVVPKWQTIASTYKEAVQKVFDKIKETRDGAFYNYIKDELETEDFYQTEESIALFQKLEEEQKGYKTFVLAAQFGIRHQGRSPETVLEIISVNNNLRYTKEFPLGLYVAGIMLLTHPDRLQYYHDLYIDCPGDKFISDNSLCPCIIFSGGKIRINARSSHSSGDFGSVSGFLFSSPNPSLKT